MRKISKRRGYFLRLGELFWPKVCISAPDVCWEWCACMHSAGYGKMGVLWDDGKWGTTTASRVAHYLHTRDEPPVVRHTCDNKICCNPEHLVGGTHADNARDKVRRGRSLRGEQHPGAKLSRVDVQNIRIALDLGESQVIIARRFGVASNTISSIWTQTNWKDVE